MVCDRLASLFVHASKPSFDHLHFTYLLDKKSWSANLSKKELIQTMSVDQAFRKMIRREVETQLRPLQHAVTELGVLRALAERLQPIANFLGGAPFGASLALRRGPGRPPGSVKAKGRRGRRPTGANDRPCAIIGCGRPSRTKGYCAAHYQKLRMLIRTKRRPSAWSDYAPADSVKDVVLPRGRAAVKALRVARQRRRKR